MDLHPLDSLGLQRQANAGWAQAIRHGPLTVDQVLARGLTGRAAACSGGCSEEVLMLGLGLTLGGPARWRVSCP